VAQQDLSKIGVRAGLFMVRMLLRLKGLFQALWSIFARLVRPLARFFFVSILVSAYQITYSMKRRFGHWYRPAKNRAMFFLTNRYALHAVMVVIATVTGVVNVQMTSVRAESIDAFNKSLLYSIITKEDSPIIEEFADASVTGASTTDNYVEATVAVADFAAALGAANIQLAALALATTGDLEAYAFQWDAANGYLFNDVDGNGTADQVVVLVGVVGTTISDVDIIA